MAEAISGNSRPFLRWAGSKRKLLPKLTPIYGQYPGRYVEPFMGSAALFFELAPSTAVLADTNEQLVDVFCAVRDDPERLALALHNLPRGEQAYYSLRAATPTGMDRIDRAARFIFLNRYCFNGLYRTDKHGRFNVPYGRAKTGELPSLEQLVRASRLLSAAEIRCGDFESVLRDTVRAGDFVYMDPPYAVENRRVFRQYTAQTFGITDLHRISSLLDEIDRRGAVFLVSYAYCREAVEVFRGWCMRKLYTQRNISGFAKHRRTAAEMIVSNVDLTSAW